MRRWAVEYRRPVRMRFSYWIWALFGLFLITGLVLLVVHHNHHEDRVEQPVLEINMGLERVAHNSLNFTEEILSAISFSRQLICLSCPIRVMKCIYQGCEQFILACPNCSVTFDCPTILNSISKSITRDECKPLLN